jgi:hypothetical protein
MIGNLSEMIERVEQAIGCELDGFDVLPAQDDKSFVGGNISESDRKIMPFRYRVEGQSWWLRGAFTNGDPVWEENDPEAFAIMMGEEPAQTQYDSEDGEDMLIFDHRPGCPTYTTYTRGTSSPLYRGDDESAARESLEMNEADWEAMLLSEPTTIGDN